ncbi:MAG: hypothetical protein RR400_00070 [Clostridia bacterium]
MNLTCRKTSCIFNDNYVCTAKEISINNVNICSSFVKGEKPKEDKSQKIFLKKIKYAPYRNSKDIKINCRSQCIFNKNCECMANGIIINDLKQSPICITHVKESLSSSNKKDCPKK